jgi:hypothetical protein
MSRETQGQIYLRRLIRLKAIMEFVDNYPKGFDIGWWTHKEECGTTACVLGWAGYDTEFQKEGLVTLTKGPVGEVWYKDRSKGSQAFCNVDAGLKFFGLTTDEAFDLFLGRYWPTRLLSTLRPHDVVKYIDLLIEGRKASLAA